MLIQITEFLIIQQMNNTYFHSRNPGIMSIENGMFSMQEMKRIYHQNSCNQTNKFFVLSRYSEEVFGFHARRIT